MLIDNPKNDLKIAHTLYLYHWHSKVTIVKHIQKQSGKKQLAISYKLRLNIASYDPQAPLFKTNHRTILLYKKPNKNGQYTSTGKSRLELASFPPRSVQTTLQKNGCIFRCYSKTGSLREALKPSTLSTDGRE